MARFLSLLIILLSLSACSSKEKPIYTPSEKINPYEIYKEGLNAMKENDYFFANKKFEEAELNFIDVNLAARSAIMSVFCLYGINFYDEALDNLNRFFKLYPADKNIMYARYLEAIIYFEQISDEKRDLKPLIKSLEKINSFLLEYPNTDYSIDLKFKKDLIRNQLAAKEMYVAKHYIKTQKWIPAISRLKIILKDYEKTIFVEEALLRLVEIHYYLGLEEEAKKYTQILGYNYNSSEWYESAYKIFNKKYEFKLEKKEKEKKKGFLDRIIETIN
jgi:outer membrane protein assembly factor BamD